MEITNCGNCAECIWLDNEVDDNEYPGVEVRSEVKLTKGVSSVSVINISINY